MPLTETPKENDLFYVIPEDDVKYLKDHAVQNDQKYLVWNGLDFIDSVKENAIHFNTFQDNASIYRGHRLALSDGRSDHLSSSECIECIGQLCRQIVNQPGSEAAKVFATSVLDRIERMNNRW